MAKIKILGTGLSGLVGSRITELLSDKYEFENLSLETGIDITDKATVMRIVDNFPGEVILHLAAKADVDGCERDKPQGENGEAFKINVLGTQNLIDAAQKTGKKIIYISTDFVFSGEETPEGGYDEDSQPNPINWYGQTKYEAEKRVSSSGLPFLIARICYPYRTSFPLKKDFFRAILERLKEGKEVRAITDHLMTPTFIDDIAFGLDRLMETRSQGIYHLVGSQFITPYDAALLIARTFNLNSSLISKTTRGEYFKEGAKRPFNLSLRNDKIQKLNVKMKTFEEGLEEMKRQLCP